MPYRHAARGFTLIELLVALVVAAILASIALPSYRSFVLRSQRDVAKTFLVDLVKRQEEWSLKTRAYATGFGPILGIEGSEIHIDRRGLPVNLSSGKAIYSIRFADQPVPSGSAFAFVATAVGSQLRDTDCLSLTVNANGSRMANGSAVESEMKNCWSR